MGGWLTAKVDTSYDHGTASSTSNSYGTTTSNGTNTSTGGTTPTISPEFTTAFNALKGGVNMQGATPDQQKAIDYWAKGGILGWNRLLLEFVARADLPPAPLVIAG